MLRKVDTVHMENERRFARSVRSEQGDPFARMNVNIYVDESNGAVGVLKGKPGGGDSGSAHRATHANAATSQLAVNSSPDAAHILSDAPEVPEDGIVPV